MTLSLDAWSKQKPEWKHDNRMELFDQKLEKSIEDQRDFSAMQSELNQYFLDFIRNANGKK